MRKVSYVVGFLFSGNGNAVVLIEKQRPAWQRDHLNGVGGHIEDGETPEQAMRREFKEETNADVDSWIRFASLKGVSDVEWTVHFFYAFDEDAFHGVEQMTDERLRHVFVSRLCDWRIIPNLNWLIPMALSMSKETAAEFWIEEAYSKVAVNQ